MRRIGSGYIASGNGAVIVAGSGATVRSAPYNATGNGTTDDHQAFESAMAALGDVIVPEGTYLIADHMTVPADARLIFQTGGILKIAPGKRVTVLGEIVAGQSQCFQCEVATGTITGVVDGNPMVVTSDGDHELDTDDWVRIEGVGGVEITSVTNPDFDPDGTHEFTLEDDKRFYITTAAPHGFIDFGVVNVEDCDVAKANGDWFAVVDDTTHLWLYGSKPLVGTGKAAGTTGTIWGNPVSGAPCSSANGEYQVTSLTSTTFSLQQTNGSSGSASGGRWTAFGHVRFATESVASMLPSPWSSSVSIHAPAKQTTVCPGWFGARFNNIDSGIAGTNSTALELAQWALPDTGGVVAMPGYLTIRRSIGGNFMRAFVGSAGNQQWRSKAIVHEGAIGTSGIIKSSEGGGTDLPAYKLVHVFPVHEPAHTAPIGLRGLTIISQGNGVETYSGGKELVLKDIVVSQCLGHVGLYIYDTSGFILDNVYLFRNRKSGAWFELCFCVEANMLKARENGLNASAAPVAFQYGGVGIYIVGCSVWNGSIYPEANGSYGLDAYQLGDSNLNIWHESNREYEFRQAVSGVNPQGLNQFQSRIRNSDCFLQGKTGVEYGSGFELDAKSAAHCIIMSGGARKGEMHFQHMACDYAGMVTHPVRQLAMPIVKDAANLHINLNEGAWTGGDAAYVPTMTIVDSESYSGYGAIELEFPADAFAHVPDSGWLNPCFMGATGQGSPMQTFEYEAGDMFITRFTVRLDEAATDYYRGQNAIGGGAIPLFAQITGEGIDAVVRHTFMDVEAGTPVTFEQVALCQSAGTGVRLLFFFGVGSQGAGPSEAIKIYLESIDFLHVPGAVGSRASIATPRLPALADSGFPSSLTGQVFSPGYYITAPRIGMRGELIYPMNLGGINVFSGTAAPNEIHPRGSIVFNTNPSGGTLLWVCTHRTDTLFDSGTNADNGDTVLTVVSTSGMSNGDKIAVVISGADAGGDFYSHATLHWTTIASVDSGTQLTLTAGIPSNHYIQQGWKIYTMRWAAVST